MPTTTRKLRSSTPSIIEDEDDDEFGTAQPLFLADLYTPENNETSDSTPTKTITKKKSSVKKVSKTSKRVFECDANLPAEGLELEVKLFLLQKLDLKGGPSRASTYTNRYLSRLCNEYPLILGSTQSRRRRRVTWLADRWKRDKDFDDTRTNLMLLAESSVLQPLPTSAPPVTKSEPVNSKRSPALKTEPLSPPKITNKKSASMFSPNRKKSK